MQGPTNYAQILHTAQKFCLSITLTCINLASTKFSNFSNLGVFC